MENYQMLSPQKHGLTVSRRVFFFVHDRRAVCGGGRRRGAGNAAHRAHAGRPGPDAAVVRVRMRIRHGCPSVGRRIAATDRRRCRRLLLLVRFQGSQLWAEAKSMFQTLHHPCYIIKTRIFGSKIISLNV